MRAFHASGIGSTARRKYLTVQERDRFVRAAMAGRQDIALFCILLADTGCRISEALSLTPRAVDHTAGYVTFETLKKRRKGIYRSIPMSPRLTAALNARPNADPLSSERIWTWSRMTAYRHVMAVMEAAYVCGPHATPKGLRHCFGVAAVLSKVPLNIVQRWMGHASLNTTAIYLDVCGPEERRFACRMWRGQPGVGD